MEKTFIGLSKKLSYILAYLIPFLGIAFVLKKEETKETRYVGAQSTVIYVILIILYFIGKILSIITRISKLFYILTVPISFAINILSFLILLVIIYLIYCVLVNKDVRIPILDPFVKAIIDTF